MNHMIEDAKERMYFLTNATARQKTVSFYKSILNMYSVFLDELRNDKKQEETHDGKIAYQTLIIEVSYEYFEIEAKLDKLLANE